MSPKPGLILNFLNRLSSLKGSFQEYHMSSGMSKKSLYLLGLVLLTVFLFSFLLTANAVDTSECVVCHGPAADFNVLTSPTNCSNCHKEKDVLRNGFHSGGTTGVGTALPSDPTFWDRNAFYGYGTFQEPDPINTVYPGTIHNAHRPQEGNYGCDYCHAKKVGMTNYENTYVDCTLCHTSVSHSTMGTQTGVVTPERLAILNNMVFGTDNTSNQVSWNYWKNLTCVNSNCHGVLHNADGTFKANYPRPECNSCHPSV